MTLEECLNLNLGKGYKMQPPATCTMPSFVPPDDPTIGNQAKTPEAKPTYNGMSLNDLKELQKFKYTDDLHRPDLINRDYSRAKRLLEFGSAVGAHEFIKSYLKK